MTILIAPDKFKGSLTAPEVCSAIENGLKAIDPLLHIVSIPMADGGDGTGDILTRFSGGRIVQLKVLDPLFREIAAEYGLSKDGKTAFVEMAKASGLQLLTTEERNPLHTTTFGTGQLIRNAIGHGADHIIMGIGGSATNDAGIGMAAALGFSFLSENHTELVPTGMNLIHLRYINAGNVHPDLYKTKFTVLCDVDNSLCGPEGAAFVFGPQKGADPETVNRLDEGLRNFRIIAEGEFHVDLEFSGAGAAGGLGAGSKAFLGARVERGFEFISRYTHLESAVQMADLVITGEGKIDSQTLSGKVVKGVADLAAKYGKSCVAFAGACDLPPDGIKNLHLAEIISLTSGETTTKDSMEHASALLQDAAKRYLTERNQAV